MHGPLKGLSRRKEGIHQGSLVVVCLPLKNFCSANTPLLDRLRLPKAHEISTTTTDTISKLQQISYKDLGCAKCAERSTYLY
jgi:hypothetical protein